MRPNRRRVLEDLSVVSDDALMALVDALLAGVSSETTEAIDSLASIRKPAADVAERLLTGRRAEDFFQDNSESIIGVAPAKLIDRRNAACGYDFGVDGHPELAIEVKGLKRERGQVLFTDREWSEAGLRLDHYWLVVVGNLALSPGARFIRNPRHILVAKCSYQTTVSAVWKAIVGLTS
jgi:hypothetical protein